jgi:small subunit ribosomal protein S17
MAKKTFIGKVVSKGMQNTVVVEIERVVRHPLYKKTLRRTKRLKADTSGFDASLGQYVQIEQSRPLSRDKHFKVIKVIKEEKKNGAA